MNALSITWAITSSITCHYMIIYICHCMHCMLHYKEIINTLHAILHKPLNRTLHLNYSYFTIELHEKQVIHCCRKGPLITIKLSWPGLGVGPGQVHLQSTESTSVLPDRTEVAVTVRPWVRGGPGSDAGRRGLWA
jgi:hypothetical protein